MTQFETFCHRFRPDLGLLIPVKNVNQITSYINLKTDFNQFCNFFISDTKFKSKKRKSTLNYSRKREDVLDKKMIEGRQFVLAKLTKWSR